MTTFVDRVVLHVAAGNGGHGVASVKREKFKPLGGPDGGNGGRGGSVILAVDPQSTTLLDYHHTPHRKATNGKPGGGDERNGADGGDLVLPVPEGTVVKDGNGSVLADLVGHDATFVVARGGRGGLGNKALASPRRKAPGFALLGEPGESIDIVLELKSLADVALIGFPSAGKSSLVSVMSAARPKIADYPFTTLVPNLGVVTAGSQRFTIADVPGLIPGASEGKGLGLEFLRHVERCSVLVHVVDCATLEPGRDPMTDLEVIEAELAAYVTDDSLGGRPLSERTRIIVLNKADVPDAHDLAEMVRPMLEERGLEVHIVSAVAHTGLKELHLRAGPPRARGAGRDRVAGHGAPAGRHPARSPSTTPASSCAARTPRTARSSGCSASGRRAGSTRPTSPTTRPSATSPTGSAGSVSRRPCSRPAPSPGSTVLIGPEDNAVVFDWEPTMSAGAELLGGPRGSDVRLEAEGGRKTRDERRAHFHARKDAQTAARDELAQERQAGHWSSVADED